MLNLLNRLADQIELTTSVPARSHLMLAAVSQLVPSASAVAQKIDRPSAC
jgi:hypothetical protein